MDNSESMPTPRTPLSIREMRNISLWILVMLATSWSLTTHNSTIDLRGFGAIITPIACFILMGRIWKSFRVLLDQGVRIPRHVKLGGRWSAFAIFPPMIIGFSVSPDGANGAGFHFGGGLSIITGLLGGAAIMLYETLRHIESVRANGSKASPKSLPAGTFPPVALPLNF